ncbi:MAG: hypothetical protein KKG64_00120 [Firmicutes bacterium]|nr:hypothetical protein [Bacillota bacterium]
MDNHYSSVMAETYRNLQKAIKSKVIKACLYTSSGLVILTIAFFLLYDQHAVYLILFYISLGLFLLLLLITLLLELFFVSEKPLYEYLYPKVMEDHNYEESIFMTYEAYPKQKEFFPFGMLYLVISNKIVYSKVSFESRNGYLIDVYDTYVYTSTGKINIVYLNGYYFVVKNYGPDKFQLRTHGSPHVKPKYNRLLQITDVRAFVEADQMDIDPKYINLYHLLQEEYHSPSVSMGGNGCDLHIGITIKPMRRHIKKIDEEIYQKLRRGIIQMIDVANNIK